jgi:hypothetical protein
MNSSRERQKEIIELQFENSVEDIDDPQITRLINKIVK